jgi:hypothetical protein
VTSVGHIAVETAVFDDSVDHVGGVARIHVFKVEPVEDLTEPQGALLGHPAGDEHGGDIKL